MLAWWDDELGYGIHAVEQGPDTNYAQTTAECVEAALAFADKIGFPDHGMVVGKPSDDFFTKEIKTMSELLGIFKSIAISRPIWLESDMRAHRNPRRMSMISRCADVLEKRLLSACPDCRNPGFGNTTLIVGAACSLCAYKTRVARAKLLRCEHCGYEAEEFLRETTDPVHCDFCNP